VGLSLIQGLGLHEVISKSNLIGVLKLHRKMHSNGRYFDSIHNRNFQFCTQLIERYHNPISVQQKTYLFLTSSNVKKSNLFKINIPIELIIHRLFYSNLFDVLTIDKEHEVSNSSNLKQNILNISYNFFNYMSIPNEISETFYC
jgi:hypothetical protein